MGSGREESRMVSLQLFVLLSVFIFFAGAIAGMLFCGHVAHEDRTTASGLTGGDRFAAQIERLENKVAANPGNVDSWTQLGNLYFDTEQYEKAIDAYKKSLSLEPNNADVWTDLGILYRQSRQPLKAIEAFDKAIAVDPKHEASRLHKGDVLRYDLADREGAVHVWEDVLKVNPHAIALGGGYLTEVIKEADDAGGALSSSLGR